MVEKYLNFDLLLGTHATGTLTSKDSPVWVWLIWGFALKIFQSYGDLEAGDLKLWNSSGEDGNQTPNPLLCKPRAWQLHHCHSLQLEWLNHEESNREYWFWTRKRSLTLIIVPPFAKAGDIKTHSSVPLSVCHKNFNLAHIFWSITDRAWYLACMILVSSPFNWYHAVTLTFHLLQGQSCLRIWSWCHFKGIH